MEIGIEIAQENVRGSWNFQDAVVHLGLNIPSGKQGVVLQGQGIAEHHGKIFFSYDSYRYVNLTSLPTYIFRSPTFCFQLDQFMPQCEIFVGDRLGLGTAMVEITRLVPPERVRPPETEKVTGNLRFRHLDCRHCKSARASKIVRAVGELVYRVRDYTSCDEILRASVDWLADLFTGGKANERTLQLGSPEAIAARRRQGGVPTWPEANVPIEMVLTSGCKGIKSFGDDALQSSHFDTGKPFRFEGSGGRTVGLGAGILEETSDSRGLLKAGHVLVIQYPPKKKPGRDDLCVLYHVSAHVSELLAGLQAARLRQQQELEWRGGVESRGLFHDMEGICTGARGAAVVARANLGTHTKAAALELAGVVDALDMLKRHIDRGRAAFEIFQDFHYQRVNLLELCQSVLTWLFDESESLRATRDWQVQDLSNGDAALHDVPCDRFAIERVLFNLVSNAKRAIAFRGPDLLVKRVHTLLDVVERHGLPYALICIADDGPGLHPEALKTIFEGRFTTKSGGHGWGAQVVAEQMRRHQGFIEVASTAGRGTVVSILLPAPRLKGATRADKRLDWLAPYEKCAMHNALVSRSDLETLLAKDKALSKWYYLQGRRL